jgi:hypothetical protein
MTTQRGIQTGGAVAFSLLRDGVGEAAGAEDACVAEVSAWKGRGLLHTNHSQLLHLRVFFVSGTHGEAIFEVYLSL